MCTALVGQSTRDRKDLVPPHTAAKDFANPADHWVNVSNSPGDPIDDDEMHLVILQLVRHRDCVSTKDDIGGGYAGVKVRMKMSPTLDGLCLNLVEGEQDNFA